MLGMRDTWTALQFDAAVSLFGTWAENKLSEFDPKTGKHLYSVDDILSDEPLNGFKQTLANIRGMVGSMRGGAIDWRKGKKK